MQAFVANEDLQMADGMLTIQVNTSAHRSSTRTCMNPVELGKSLLTHSRDGDTEEVKMLISRGAPFTTDWLGTSPLHLASMHGHLDTVEVLLRGGISRDARTKVDRTPLHIAAQEGHANIIELLLNHGADIEAADMLRMTPLHWAVDRGHINCVIKLLEHGADVNAISKFDKTPIIIAIDNNRADLLDMLQNPTAFGSPKLEGASYMSQLEEADTAAEKLIVMDTENEDMEEVATTTITRVSSPSTSRQRVDIEQETVEADTFLNTKESVNRPKATVIAGTSSSTQSNLQYLRSHVMLPPDESNLVASAMESGQTVVLTEAGKLALNLTRGGSTTSNKKTTSTVKRKIVTLTAEQLAALTGKATKVVPISKKISISSTKFKNINEVPHSSKIITTTTGKRVFPTGAQYVMQGVECSSNDVERGEEDLLDVRPTATSEEDEALMAKFEQAKREADEYRKQLQQKEKEAEEYRKRLKSLAK